MIDVDFSPGRALKHKDQLTINGKQYVFTSDVVRENMKNYPVAIFTDKDAEDVITLVEKPLVGLSSSHEIDRNIYWSSVTGWMLK